MWRNGTFRLTNVTPNPHQRHLTYNQRHPRSGATSPSARSLTLVPSSRSRQPLGEGGLQPE